MCIRDRSRTTFFANLCRVKRSLKPYQNEHNLVKDTGEGSKKHVTLTWISPRKSCSLAHLPFPSPNPKILKAFLKTLPTKMKPTKCPAREKKMRQEKRKKKGGEKAKCRNFYFLRMPELRKPIFCIWIRRPPSVRPVNRFMVSFRSLYHDSDLKTTRLA